MNWFQSIYCNQYAELKAKPTGAANARKNGIIIITVTLVINIFTAVELLMLFGKQSFLGHEVNDFFHQFSSGRAAGKLIGLLLMGIIGSIIYFTIGRESYYNKTIETFEMQDDTEKKATSRKGAAFFLTSIGVFIVLMFIVAFLQ